MIFTVLLWVPAVVSAGWIGPSNYWECILEGMQDVKNDQVAQEITRLCQDGFSGDLSVPEPLEGPPGLCIIEYGEDVTSPYAAQQIQTACNVIYAPPPKSAADSSRSSSLR